MRVCGLGILFEVQVKVLGFGVYGSEGPIGFRSRGL